MKRIKLGNLTIVYTSTIQRTLYLDWRPWTDPKHRRVVVARGTVWRPFTERVLGKNLPLREARLLGFEVVLYDRGPYARREAS